MWRQTVKVGGARALALVGLDLLLARLNGRHDRPLVLAYHRVVPEYRPDPAVVLAPMLTSVAMLEAHLDWLGRRYRFVSLDEVGASLGASPRGRPLAAITIDDGYRDAFELAVPLLLRKGIPATFFVVTDLLGRSDPPLFDRLYYQLGQALGARPERQRLILDAVEQMRLPRHLLSSLASAPSPYDALQAMLTALEQTTIRNLLAWLEADLPFPREIASALQPLDWEMLQRMVKAGFTIGSHTRNHIFLTRETASVVADELGQSKKVLESHLGAPVRHFAYPAGEFDRAAVRAVARAGYECAFTLCEHLDSGEPRLTIPRTVLWENTCRDDAGAFSSALMQAQASGIFEMVRPRCHLPHRTRRTACHAAGASR